MLYLDTIDVETLNISSSKKDVLTQFLEDGYLHIQNDLSKKDIDDINNIIKNWEKDNKSLLDSKRNEYGQYPRIVNFHQQIKEFGELFSQSKSSLYCDEIFGNETVMYTSLFFRYGTSQPSHRDSPLFHTRPIENNYLGVWFSLQEANLENGALFVYPGSHKLDDNERLDLAHQLYKDTSKIPPIAVDLWRLYQDTLTSKAEKLGIEKKVLETAPGDTIIWHPGLLHGGSPVQNKNLTRTSLVFHVIPIGTSVHHMDSYFNPSAEIPLRNWEYLPSLKRKYINHTNDVSYVNFG